MQNYLYLSLIPEALIMSQLPPDRFGAYLAIGSRRQIEGPAVFIEVDQSADLSKFRLAEAAARCVPHADGSPRRSVYVAIHDVLPRVPLEAMVRAHLTTPAGITLTLTPAEWHGGAPDKFYLYQELGPVYPRVVSRLAPLEFCHAVTSPDRLVSVPRLAFIDLKLGALARSLEPSAERGLPYQHLDHLRECLAGLERSPDHLTKTVNRGLRPDILYYLMRSGLFVGDTGGLRFFPLPSEDVLESEHYLWWHSAQSARGY
jgi:hypothetical protein